MHPCGVVLSRQPMTDLTPTFLSNKGYPTTHFDMDAVEAIGLVKIDILAQGGLAVMRDTQAALAKRGVRVDLEHLEPWEDPAVWDLIAGGGARAVHHIESPAMVGLCRQCNVRDIDGLIAIVSVIRPGAANEQKKVRFARRYQGLEPVTYPHPSLEACLREHVRAGGLRGAHPANLRGVRRPAAGPGRPAAARPGKTQGRRYRGDPR